MMTGRDKYNAAKEELYNLMVNGRIQVSEKIRIARSLGDLSDNPAYDAAKEEQRMIEDRIDELKSLLKELSHPT